MKLTLKDRIRAFFARDKEAFWFQIFSDEERELREMDVWQLAEIISDESVQSKKKIVAEHLLNLRLATIQSNATYHSAIIGLIGVTLGAIITSLVS